MNLNTSRMLVTSAESLVDPLGWIKDSLFFLLCVKKSDIFLSIRNIHYTSVKMLVLQSSAVFSSGKSTLAIKFF